MIRRTDGDASFYEDAASVEPHELNTFLAGTRPEDLAVQDADAAYKVPDPVLPAPPVGQPDPGYLTNPPGGKVEELKVEEPEPVAEPVAEPEPKDEPKDEPGDAWTSDVAEPQPVIEPEPQSTVEPESGSAWTADVTGGDPGTHES